MADNDAETIARRAVRALSPAFADCFSGRTRKLQATLLVVAGILLLLALGVLSVQGNVSVFGVKLSVENSDRVLLGVASVICLYFELIVAARCYADWNQWRLKSRLGWLRATALFSELERRQNEASAFGPAKSPGEYINEALRLSKLSEGERQSNLRAESDKRWAKLIDAARVSPEFQEFESRFRASSNIRRARLLLEIWFPLLFGGASMLLAVVRIAQSRS